MDDSATVGDRLASFKYFHVHALPYARGRITRDYAIINKRGEHLGLIKFHTAWRQHVLSPAPDTIWNKGCLANVNEFIEGIGRKWT